jgi:predicted RNase H-like nuclease (RuvC/YqgF family)
MLARNPRKQERKDMEQDEKSITERLEAATAAIEKALTWLEERVAAASALSGEVERITATVEGAVATRRETEMAEKLAAVERELAEVKAASAGTVVNPLRRTMPAATAEMLAKRGIGEGPVDVRALDAHRGEDATAARRCNRVKTGIRFQGSGIRSDDLFHARDRLNPDT